jgi:hypothetical protein
MSQQELILYAILFNTALGFVLGLIPLVLGFVRGRVKYGLLGLAASIIGGAILGVILSIPAALIFTWLVLRRQPAEPPDGGNGIESDRGL